MEPKTIDQNKDTGLAISLIFLLICWSTKNYTFINPAIICLILTMAIPKIFTYPAKIWFGFSHFLGEFVSRILLTVLFFLLIVPIGFIRKLSGKDSMNLKKWHNGNQSVFTERNVPITASDLEKPF